MTTKIQGDLNVFVLLIAHNSSVQTVLPTHSPSSYTSGQSSRPQLDSQAGQVICIALMTSSGVKKAEQGCVCEELSLQTGVRDSLQIHCELYRGRAVAVTRAQVEKDLTAHLNRFLKSKERSPDSEIDLREHLFLISTLSQVQQIM